ncbi:MAG: AAA family ATPase, partial [Planctomycetia bacterium]|nr:AAA family ATPase [Planctomycetia bacterium]
MRILAIRGRNLASLEGDFEVRFDAPPLRDVGIFAIAGPTGAGKSTLLDALCLALYDRTPRLDGNSAVRVGRADEAEKDRLGDQDTRALLRRGAGEGRAEVDFVGRDARRYRATWAVRRARGAAGGRLQGVEVGLTDLETGAPLAAGTKTETLAEIARRVGLPFDQFRRSVLLAQGDFAAFLQANAGDRADLLERMTGTEL